MQDDAGQLMKDRLRADLLTAMKARQRVEARTIRALVAALDNAEAPPAAAAAATHDFHAGTAEVTRLRLSASRVHEVVSAEVQERERAAAEFDRLEKPEHAAALRAEAQIASRYLA